MEAHFAAGNQRGSARALEEITKRFPNAPLRASASGLHALLTDRPTDAIAAFSEARSLLIDNKGSRLELAQVAYWLGRSFEYSGDLRQAAQWLGKATKLNSAHALAHYWAGQIYHQEQKPDKMVASYEKAVALDPGIAPMAWFFLGSHYVTAGKKDEAVRALEMFLQHYPENSGDMVVEAKVLLGQLR
jgi:tetratricopeptide (TPR) repeat protein